MRRRYYRVKKTYPKQKWLINNNEIVINGMTVNAGNYVLLYEPITQNPSRTLTSGAGTQTSASILKTGRFRFNGVFNSAATYINYIVGISFIPEGYTITANTNVDVSTLGECFFYKHPEWLLSWKRLDYSASNQINEFSLSSRLKRNLNSGDGIVFFVIAVNKTNTNVQISNIDGTVSYVCRSN